MKIRMPTLNDLFALENAVLDKPLSPWYDKNTGQSITKVVTFISVLAMIPLMKVRWDHSSAAGSNILESLLYSIIVSAVTVFLWWTAIILLAKYPRWNLLIDAPSKYLLDQWAFPVGFLVGLVLFGTNANQLFPALLLGILFNSIVRIAWKAKLGIFTAFAIFVSVSGLSEFVFVIADWDVIFANRGTLFVGITINSGIVNPDIENESWRLWPSVILTATIICVALGTANIRKKKFLIWYTLFYGMCLYFVWAPAEINYDPNPTIRRLFFLSLWGALCYNLTHDYCNRVEEYIVNRLRSYIVLATVFLFFMTVTFLDPPDFLIESGIAEPGIDPSQWGGLYVNLILISAALVMGFSLAIMLAFGRRSNQPFLSWPSTFIIEFVRSGPMVAWLFIALFILPDIVNPFYEIDVVTSSIFAFTIFGACYIAEVLRGGLQDVRTSQKEAAIALGLSPFQVQLFVELPSAIRTTIPAIVSIFIGLWKDTTLLYLLGVLDFFYISRILPNTEFRFGSNYVEPLLFAATLFWVFAFILSRISLKVEAGLGLTKEGGGERT